MDQKIAPVVYDAFADIYDDVMRDVDYVSWARHIINLTQRYKVNVKTILELACGTGSLSIQLGRIGYKVVGIDRSPTMLNHAKTKARLLDLTIPFLQSSMESFTHLALEPKFDLVTCLYDSLNYLLEEKDVQATFQGAYDHLRKEGAFIFDVTTEYNLLHNFSGFTFAENFTDASYIWENDYDIMEKICSSKVTVFTNYGGQYKKHVETHNQRIYTNQFLTETLEQVGFEVMGMFHNMSENPVQKKCERIHFVCKKTA
jgi:SAM-dependent methyltransferase